MTYENILGSYISLVRVVRVVMPYLKQCYYKYKITLPLPYHSYHSDTNGKDLAMPHLLPYHFFRATGKEYLYLCQLWQSRSLPLLPLVGYKNINIFVVKT